MRPTNLIYTLLLLPFWLSGQNQALLIAVEEYRHENWESPRAIEEAVALGAVLSTRYGYRVKLAENPTKEEIRYYLDGFVEQYYQPQLLNKGQLLIYFIGHGLTEDGLSYFLPADAQANDLSNTALSWQEVLASTSRYVGGHLLIGANVPHSDVLSGEVFRAMDLAPKTYRNMRERFNGSARSRLFLALDPERRRASRSTGITHALRDGLNHLANRYETAGMAKVLSYLYRWSGDVAKVYGFRGDEQGSDFTFVREEDPQPSYQEPGPGNASLWKMVEEANVVEGYSFYARLYPKSRYAQKAVRRLAEFPDSMATADGKMWKVSQRPPLLTEDGMMLVRGGVYTSNIGKGPHWDRSFSVPKVFVRDFYISPKEITLSDYKKFCASVGRPVPQTPYWRSKDGPIVNIDWYDAIEYCNWLSVQNGLQKVYNIRKDRRDRDNRNMNDTKGWLVQADWKANGYRLPTVAEWEYAACHAKEEAQQEKLQRLGRSVQEWCWDWEGYGYGISKSASEISAGPDWGAYRSVRGIASDYHNSDRNCGYAYSGPASGKKERIGFRIVRNGG